MWSLSCGSPRRFLSYELAATQLLQSASDNAKGSIFRFISITFLDVMLYGSPLVSDTFSADGEVERASPDVNLLQVEQAQFAPVDELLDLEFELRPRSDS